jgi:ABC-type uncharacterized transport system involved in gliding motility auxiliary subunit
MNNRKLFSMGSLALLALLFIGLAILSQSLFRGIRLDLTENRQYTLSDGTLRLLGSLEEPVNLYLYFSSDASRDLPQVRSHARWVGEMLDEMADRSGGKLQVRRVDPKPFSPEEDEAAGFGLQALPVGATGDSLYFGVVGTNSLDDVQAMPFLRPSNEQFLEYDLAKMISSLSHPEQQKVGLLTSLDIGPGFDMQTRQARPAWVIYEQLDQLFEIETIAADAPALPEDIDLLFLVHPKDLGEPMLYAIDQFVLAGGRLVAFMDPFAESDTGGDPADPMSRLNAGSSSSLGPLLDAWGLAFDETRIVGDLLYALQVSTGAGNRPVRHLGIVSIPSQGLNSEDIVSGNLEAVNFASAGWLEPVEGATTVFSSLATTSENAAPIEASRLRFLANPDDLVSGFQPTGDRFTLAARISGKADSAFATAPGDQDPAAHLATAGDEGINIIIYADTDLLVDRMWVQRQNFFGQEMVNSFADNGTLVVNSVDNLLGSSDLINIRARASSARPFTRVDKLRLEAEGRYRATEERLNLELEETERKLVELQSTQAGADLTVLNADQQAELQRFMDQRIQIRKELREVQLNLNRDIDALGTRLKIINIVVVPVLVILMALLASQARRRRREGAGS